MINKIKMTVRTKGEKGNAFELMSDFIQKAMQQGMSGEEIIRVIRNCKSGNYDNLVRVLKENTYKPVKFNKSSQLMVKFTYKAFKKGWDLEAIENVIEVNSKNDYLNLLSALEAAIGEPVENEKPNYGLINCIN